MVGAVVDSHRVAGQVAGSAGSSVGSRADMQATSTLGTCTFKTGISLIQRVSAGGMEPRPQPVAGHPHQLRFPPAEGPSPAGLGVGMQVAAAVAARGHVWQHTGCWEFGQGPKGGEEEMGRKARPRRGSEMTL